MPLMLGLPDGIAALLTLVVVLLIGRWFFGKAPPPRVDPPLVARYLIEHKSGPWYIGYDPGTDRLKLCATHEEAFRYASHAEAEAVRAVFDSFRSAYRVVAIFEEESPDAG